MDPGRVEAGVPRALGDVQRARTDGDEEIADRRRATTDGPVAEVGRVSELEHLAEDRDPAAGKAPQQLERGQVKLDDAISAYERGTLLKRHCENKLQEAKMKVEKIVLAPNGAVGSEPAKIG